VDDYSLATGQGWLAEVRGTGESVRFLNEGYINSKHNRPLSRQDQPTGDALEAAGRKVIANELASFVKLGPGEELQGWSVSHLIDGNTDASGAIRETVVASRILFTRVIDGVPVLGPGNKVSVTFASDGTLVGFHLDWPELTRRAGNVPMADVQSVRAAADVQLGRVAGQAWSAEKAFECGYYDPGVAGLSAGKTLQAACVSIADFGPGQPNKQVVIPCEVK
jgi:hypothetical protein